MGDDILRCGLYDNYFDIIDKSTFDYILDNFNRKTDVKEDRFKRTCIFDLIGPFVKGYKTVLDVGVGQGINSLFLLKNGYMDNLIGLDNDSKVLEMFLQNAKRLGVEDRVEAVNWDMIYGIEAQYSPDCVLSMDVLYGNSSSVFGKNPGGFDSLGLDDNITVGALSDTGANKIIITRLCGNTSGTCENPYNMKQDLESVDYKVVDFGSKIYDDFALDYAISQKK
ncbi:MAG: class I SAM-dependent methyltransferase [Candidatus Aenigmarchaeota archaeon]|nr:class I SAM-dependent methyltransferase [Candidatus Aenigmarchaeota archaeon]